MSGLTADLIARAVIAATRAYGDDPLAAMAATIGYRRRGISAAASGLARVTGVPVCRVAPLLGGKPNSITQARGVATPDFLRAEAAAMRAIEQSGWRKETASAPGDAEQAAEQVDLPAPVDEYISAPPVPPPAVPERRPLGTIGASLRPAFTPCEKPAPTAPLGARIYAQLAAKPTSIAALAYLLDAKELPVIEALNTLRQQQRVTRDETPGLHRRDQLWRVAA